MYKKIHEGENTNSMESHKIQNKHSFVHKKMMEIYVKGQNIMWSSPPDSLTL